MAEVIDHSGQRFGRLVVLRREGSTGGKATWLCACACGTECVVSGEYLRSGHTKSCGCLHRETCRELCRSLSLKHGQSYTPEYRTWVSMKGRCENPTHASYKNYGGRGIRVCPTWLDSFENFLAT
jgi:hypothetical protein